MTEKEYQIQRFIKAHEGQAPKRVLRKMFKRAWDAVPRLGDMHRMAEHLVWAYKLGVEKNG